MNFMTSNLLYSMLVTNFMILSLLTMASQNEVITVQGRLRGVAHNGYVSYTGIPYATATETDGRFKKAGLAPFWSGIRDAQRPRCVTTSRIEECLQLDVYVPTSGASPWPVLVWITGGSGYYHPGKLVQQGIIVVVVYHRLGPHGFLCLNDEKIPGNAGVKDVVIALRWVRDNIVAFRGNSAKVVVAGQSFGAAMVEVLTLSPMAEGLYHGVIFQSGTTLSPWAFNYDAKERALALSRMFSSSGDVSSVLLNKNTADLVAKSYDLNISYFPFGMCTEKAYKKEEQLLSKPPKDLLSNKIVNSVPVMVGYNSDEGYIFVNNLRDAKVLRRIYKDITFLIPEELKFLNEREITQVARQINDMYFRNNISMATLLAYHRDAYFINHIHRSVRLHAAASQQPVYYYQFSHTGQPGVEPEPGIKKTGAAHSDELAYLFSEKSNYEDDDGIVQQRLLKLWTNFVKYLNPTPSTEPKIWDPVNPHNIRVLAIGTELEMTSFPHAQAMQMWDDIYDKYYYGRQRTTVF